MHNIQYVDTTVYSEVHSNPVWNQLRMCHIYSLRISKYLWMSLCVTTLYTNIYNNNTVCYGCFSRQYTVSKDSSVSWRRILIYYTEQNHIHCAAAAAAAAARPKTIDLHILLYKNICQRIPLDTIHSILHLENNVFNNSVNKK